MLDISREDAIQRLVPLLQGNEAIGQLPIDKVVEFAGKADIEFCRQGSADCLGTIEMPWSLIINFLLRSCVVNWLPTTCSGLAM